jgi:predicted nucleic acid-binding protein
MPGGRFYIDSNIFANAALGDRRYGAACLRVLEDLETARIQGVASSLVLLELANALRKFGRPKIANEAVASARALLASLFEMDAELAEDGVRAASEVGQDPYDGLHVATMRKMGLVNVISTDADFEQFPGIRRIDPVAYVAERDSGERAERP